MNIAQIEKNLQSLISNFSRETFIYDLFLAYGLPKASITRLQKGNLNLSKTDGEISWKKKAFFKEVQNADLHLTISELSSDRKHNQRFIIVTDYETLLAIDTKTEDKLDIALKDLPKHYDFFLPWAGMEKAQHQDENPADVRAAVKMAKLFDEIKKDNPDESPEFIHGLNVFLSRLLFCFFAEDTNIFETNQFTNGISSHTQKDGSDLSSYLTNLFEVLNTSNQERGKLPAYLNAFPYVNGGLFRQNIVAPKFTRRSRQLIIDSGELNWSAINPDIFGSMFQSVILADQRGNLGQHYTSVPNIMKVIEPLFLNDLYLEFENANGNRKKLDQLLYRLRHIKIFDPACGSGNFLIIAYKELRQLEMKIFKEGGMMALSGISLSQFYGIEIDDFAHEIAMLSLWLAEHQMNVAFFKEFGRTNPTLPLKEAGKIVQGNATRLDWEEVCPKVKDSEIYILGNPPYLGYSVQNKIQKEDMAFVFKGFKSFKSLDYIVCWFLLGSKYVRKANAQCAFVSTNSICQGEQVAIFWPEILTENLEIGFAHQSFKWSNSAKGSAGVTCIIAGLRNTSKKDKLLFSENHKLICENISPYLTNTGNLYIQTRNSPLSKLPKLGYGSSALDGGNLSLTTTQKNEIINEYPIAKKFIYRLMGAQELLKDIERWGIWVEGDELKEALSIKPFAERFNLVKHFRLKSKRKSTVDAAEYSHRFGEPRFIKDSLILLPKVSSERRTYLPIGYFSSDIIVLDKAFPLYKVEPYLFGVLSSLMHSLWLKAIGGKLETRLSYSSSVVYNTFPFPPISTHRKNEITQTVFRILEEREKHSEKTLAQLYDPDKMPEDLREAHRQNDLAIERCYRSTPFKSDEERLEYLFKLYEKMIAEEKAKGTLFEKEKKTRKKKT